MRILLVGLLVVPLFIAFMWWRSEQIIAKEKMLKEKERQSKEELQPIEDQQRAGDARCEVWSSTEVARLACID